MPQVTQISQIHNMYCTRLHKFQCLDVTLITSRGVPCDPDDLYDDDYDDLYDDHDDLYDDHDHISQCRPCSCTGCSDNLVPS